MILNIFDFVETPVREIMTPRVDMCAIDVDTSLEDLVKVLNNERHSRLPVYKETVDNIVGILSNRDFLEWYTEHRDEPFDLMKLVMPPVYVPYHKKIDDLLTELRKTGNQLAIVVDEYGGTAGLVTLEDILEEIVGEIRDEDDMDEDEDVQKLKDGRYILDPLMTLSDLEYELDVELKPPENSHVETLSGLIQATLGIIPSPGAEVKIQGYTFRVYHPGWIRSYMAGVKSTVGYYEPEETAAVAYRQFTEDREVIIESGVNESCDFALRADGDGMAPTILAGDLVFIRSQNSVADGEIAVVAIGDEIAIKRIFHGPGDSIQLICDNSAKYRPAIAELIGLDRIRILGRVIGLKRTL